MPNSVNNPRNGVAIQKRITLGSGLIPYNKIQPVSKI